MSEQSSHKRHLRRRVLLGTLAAPVTFFLISCDSKTPAASSPAPAEPKASAPAPVAPQSISRRVGINPWPGVMPLKTAEHDGLFKANGLDMKLTLFASISQMMEAFNAGNIDAVIIDPGTLLVSAAGGVAQKFVFVTDFSDGADAVVVEPSIKSIKEFKGKKISVEMGSIGHFLLLTALAQNGMSTKDVTLVNQTADLALAAFAAGKTKIAVSYEPFITQVTSKGKGNVLFSTRETKIAPDVMSVRQAYLDQNPEAVPRFIKTWYGVLRARETKMPEALIIESKALEVSVEDYQSFSSGVRTVTDPKEVESFLSASAQSPGLARTSSELAVFLKQQKLLEKDPPPIDSLIDPTYIRKYLSDNA